MGRAGPALKGEDHAVKKNRRDLLPDLHGLYPADLLADGRYAALYLFRPDRPVGHVRLLDELGKRHHQNIGQPLHRKTPNLPAARLSSRCWPACAPGSCWSACITSCWLRGTITPMSTFLRISIITRLRFRRSWCRSCRYWC